MTVLKNSVFTLAVLALASIPISQAATVNFSGTGESNTDTSVTLGYSLSFDIGTLYSGEFYTTGSAGITSVFAAYAYVSSSDGSLPVYSYGLSNLSTEFGRFDILTTGDVLLYEIEAVFNDLESNAIISLASQKTENNEGFNEYQLTHDVGITYDEAPIMAMPIPATVWLMGSALLGLLGFGRKNKIQAQAVAA